VTTRNLYVSVLHVGASPLCISHVVSLVTEGWWPAVEPADHAPHQPADGVPTAVATRRRVQPSAVGTVNRTATSLPCDACSPFPNLWSLSREHWSLLRGGFPGGG
jgi:hypothetical protein